MSTIQSEDVREIIRVLFNEAFEGSQGGWTWFVNTEPNCGVFGTIEGLTAEQASRSVVNGGRSIAAHVEHMRWWLANVNTVARGGAWNPDWSGSWAVHEVNDQQWYELRAALRREFDLVLEAIEAVPEFDNREMLTGMLAMAPHAAHHLGTIRQMAATMKSA